MQWTGFGKGFRFFIEPTGGQGCSQYLTANATWTRVLNTWSKEAREASAAARRASRVAREASHKTGNNEAREQSTKAEGHAIMAQAKAGQGVDHSEIADHHDAAYEAHREAVEAHSGDGEAEVRSRHAEASRLHRQAKAYHDDLTITDPVVSRGVAISRDAHTAAQEAKIRSKGPGSSGVALMKARDGDHAAAASLHRRLEKRIREGDHGERGTKVADLHAIAADYHEEHK